MDLAASFLYVIPYPPHPERAGWDYWSNLVTCFGDHPSNLKVFTIHPKGCPHLLESGFLRAEKEAQRVRDLRPFMGQSLDVTVRTTMYIICI